MTTPGQSIALRVDRIIDLVRDVPMPTSVLVRIISELRSIREEALTDERTGQ